jgi:general secretion pathway protein G
MCRAYTNFNHSVPVGRKAFTLIEILIVVVILGIIAAIVVPQFSNASQVSRENTLKDELRYLRTQIVVYQAQHGDQPAGYQNGAIGANPAALFVQQMTQYTDMSGNTSATESSTYLYGPYLSKMPSNPLTGDSTIKVVTGNGSMAPDGTTAWIYNPNTASIFVNSTGTDTNGAAYATY